MERIYKRAAQVVRVTDRKLARRKELIDKNLKRNTRKSLNLIDAKERELVKDERQRRQEAWLRGALAPRHDVGSKEATYGTMPIEIIQRPIEFKSRKPDWFHITEGDRVLITEGRAKGRIAEVQSLDQEKCVVYLKDVSINLEVPEFYRAEMGVGQIMPQSIPIQIKHVKLVYPLPNKAGKPEDVIIDRLEPIGREWSEDKNELTRGHRVIHGTATIIPWPSTIKDDVKVYPVDTPDDLVQQQTYIPSLLNPPMPLGLIDELRYKYSKFRTRHDRDFREKVERFATREVERKDLIKTMRTPLQELAELRAKQRAERERPLTEEQLAKIGEIMAQEQAAKAAPTPVSA